MAVGIFVLLDFTLDADLIHGIVIVLFFLAFSIAAAFVVLSGSNIPSYSQFVAGLDVRHDALDRLFVLLVFYVSLAASFYYYYLVGFNAVFLLLSGGVGSGELIDLRLAAYSGDEYFAPGYFNQFKNTLLPLSFLCLAFGYRISGHRANGFVLVVMLGLVVAMVAGTGQRAFLVGFLICGLMVRGLLNKVFRVSDGHFFFLLILVFFALFGALSLALGRSDQGGAVAAFVQLWDRIFYEQQYGALHAFRYIEHLGVTLGSDWLQDFAGVLPGVKGSDLQHLIHERVYGTSRGTIPPSVWGSIYYNFGLVGVVVIGGMMGAFYSWVAKMFLGCRQLSLVEVVSVVYLFYYLGAWVGGGPMQMVNNGALTVVLLLCSRSLYRALVAGVGSRSIFR